MFERTKEKFVIMRIPLALLAALALISAPPPALSHDDATLDAMPSPHGGQTRMAGAYHFELVLDRAAQGDKSAAARVHLSDHGGQAVPAQGASGTLTLLGPGGKSVIKLVPDGAASLAGSGVYRADPALKAVLSVSLPGGQVAQARFEPFKSAPAAAVNAR